MLEASFELIVPLVIASLIDKGIVTGDKAHIYRQVAILGVFAVVGCVTAITAQYFAARAAIGFATDVRRDMFSHLMKLSHSDIDGLGINTMITRITTDVNTAQNGVNMFLRLFLRSPFVVFGAMIMAFTIDFRSALVFAVTIAVLFTLVVIIMFVNISALKEVQSRLDLLTGNIRENLMGVRVLRAFNHEDSEMKDFEDNNLGLVSKAKRAGRIGGLMNPLTYSLINLGICALIYVGAIRLGSGALSGGQVVALYNYMSQILVELIKLANLVVILNRGLASVDRVADVFDIKPSMEYGDKTLNNEDGVRFVFDNAHLRYEGDAEDSLKGISFEAKSGETVGIIGGTGSGKTSLVNLLGRLYDVTEGRVLINDRDIRDLSLEEINKTVGIVRQRAVLFKGSIRDNLLMGAENADDDSLMKAVKTAQALEVVEGKGGLDGTVEQGGRNFSGGQRQRLSIARTLAAKTPVLVLDDSSSALDYATDLALRRALAGLDYKPLIFVISQRTSSIKHADKILVLDDGELVGLGTHEELLDSCDIYREIHNSQIQKSEEVTA